MNYTTGHIPRALREARRALPAVRSIARSGDPAEPEFPKPLYSLDEEDHG